MAIKHVYSLNFRYKRQYLPLLLEICMPVTSKTAILACTLYMPRTYTGDSYTGVSYTGHVLYTSVSYKGHFGWYLRHVSFTGHVLYDSVSHNGQSAIKVDKRVKTPSIKKLFS